jgi:hypothetical protein
MFYKSLNSFFVHLNAASKVLHTEFILRLIVLSLENLSHFVGT